ncbi:MAG: hypothetical protein A2V50_02060 [Bacteroidetes bacterium RBG_19FT_COMBO_42_10]|nr:MAG: hypothetical protein A2V50_02060 [Bacteroidetes bacterium RBG_19FT_COMBO_42_10]
MNTRVSVRVCREYDLQKVYDHISDIYESCEGPEVSGKKVLVKPNILTDSDPARCVCTHPVVVEAMIRFLQSKGAIVFAGDSPSIHLRGFKSVKSGIYQTCESTGAVWVDFMKNPSERAMPGGGKIKIASIINEVDVIISLPKLKNHELVYFTGAIKNTLGLVPGFTKAKQHALHQDRESFSRFLVDLNRAAMPHFFLMDGIIGMEGQGPGQGTPFKTGVLVGSTNPVAMDIIASSIAGYDPMDIPTSSVAVTRKLWLKDPGEIIYDGPELSTIIRKEFKRIPVSGNTNISIRFLKNRLLFLKKTERRPVFIHGSCTGCMECIKICPVNAIAMHPEKKNHVVLTDSKCIRCFCCSEVCQYHAVEIRRKFFGE